MARIRSVKPEVRISEKVNSWPIECRYFWVLLWGYCDDYGYGRDNARLIVADAFPLDDSITAETVEGWMDLLWRDGVIERFRVGDAQYFRVVNWEEHQKISHPAKQVLPVIEEATEILRRITEDSREVPQPSEKTSPKQGAGSGDQGAGEHVYSAPSVLDAFDEVWEFWPKKVERKKSLEQFRAAARKRDLFALATDVRRFGEAYAQTTERQFVPALAVWLRGERWTDELPTGTSSPVKPPAVNRNMDTVAFFAAQEQERLEITA